MKPEKFIHIVLNTLLLSYGNKEQSNPRIGLVSFISNHQIKNLSFEIDLYINGKKLNASNQPIYLSNTNKSDLILHETSLEIGVHYYEIKIHLHKDKPSQTIKGNLIVKENKSNRVFINFNL